MVFGKKMATFMAEAAKKAAAQQGQPSAPRGGRGFASAVMEMLQKNPQPHYFPMKLFCIS